MQNLGANRVNYVRLENTEDTVFATAIHVARIAKRMSVSSILKHSIIL